MLVEGHQAIMRSKNCFISSRIRRAKETVTLVLDVTRKEEQMLVTVVFFYTDYCKQSRGKKKDHCNKEAFACYYVETFAHNQRQLIFLETKGVRETGRKLR